MAFKNQDRFKAKIAKLPAVVAAAAEKAMEQGADEIVAAMKNLCPADTGRLRDSIDWCWGPPPSTAKLSITKIPGPSDRYITIYAGSFEAYWARWVEFGTLARAPGRYRDEKHKKRNAGARGHAATPAQPFFWPSWRSHKPRVKARITRAVNAAIKQLAASQSGN